MTKYLQQDNKDYNNFNNTDSDSVDTDKTLCDYCNNEYNVNHCQ